MLRKPKIISLQDMIDLDEPEQVQEVSERSSVTEQQVVNIPYEKNYQNRDEILEDPAVDKEIKMEIIDEIILEVDELLA